MPEVRVELPSGFNALTLGVTTIGSIEIKQCKGEEEYAELLGFDIFLIGKNDIDPIIEALQQFKTSLP